MVEVKKVVVRIAVVVVDVVVEVEVVVVDVVVVVVVVKVVRVKEFIAERELEGKDWVLVMVKVDVVADRSKGGKIH